jgi:hypothetical protein
MRRPQTAAISSAMGSECISQNLGALAMTNLAGFQRKEHHQSPALRIYANHRET